MTHNYTIQNSMTETTPDLILILLNETKDFSTQTRAIGTTSFAKTSHTQINSPSLNISTIYYINIKPEEVY